MGELVLTDDEVVAIALAAGGRWPRPLPTVDVTREAQLREAAWRGRRSLGVRGLVGAGGADVPNALLDTVRRDVVDAWAVLGLRIGAAGPSRPASPFEVNGYARGADWVLETVSDHGVHGFGFAAHDDVVGRMTGLAEQALARGVTGQPGTARLWLGVVAAGRRPSLCVGAGRAEVVQVEGDRVVAGSARPVTDLRSEVARLADGIRTAGLVAL